MIGTLSQGDIILLDLSSQTGHEQKGKRPCLVVSNQVFHKQTKMTMVCHITNTLSGFPLHVKLDERTSTTGEIMCEQVKCLDVNARNAVYKETAPIDIVDEVIDTICSFFD